jgi:molybdopterin-guanine dinucleotide biosynthesis protein B
MEKLITELKTKGFKVGTIKHDVHGFEMDKPGKDSWRHKKAGADVSVISSPRKIGVVMDVDFDHDPEEIISFFPGIDIVMTEGYKRGDKPKLEVFRPEVHDTPVCKDDDTLVALISDYSIELGVPRFSLNDIDGITSFLIKYFDLHPRGAKGKRKSA